MKKIALILSILLIVGLNVEAQRRQARSSAPKTYKKSESAKKKSTKSSKPVAKINNRKSVSSKAKRITPVAQKSNSRSVATRSSRSSNSRSAAVKSNNKSVSRSVASRPDRRVVSNRNRQTSGRIGNTAKAISYNSRSVRAKRRPLSIVKTPRITNIRVRHGYIDYSRQRHGYFAHSIMNFPMRVRYPFYHNYNLVLMHSYRPQVEYPWAIYESENGENTASIEGKVMDVDYNRRTNQYVIHFGRKSPHQSATVIIPSHIAQHINYRSIKKLKRDYVSVYGLFTNYGNVPTIMIDNLDEFFVDEVSLRDFLYYN